MNKKTFLTIIALFLVFTMAGCSSQKQLVKSTDTDVLQQNAKPEPSPKVNYTAFDHFLRGSWFDMGQDYARAAIEYSDALKYDSTSVEIYNALAQDYVNLGKIGHAQEILEKSLKWDFFNEYAWHVLTSIYAQNKKNAQLKALLAEIVKKDRENWRYALQYISLLLKEGSVQQSTETAKLVFGDENIPAREYLELVELFINARKIKEGLDLFSGFPQNADSSPFISFSIGLLYESENNIDEAKKQYLSALSDNPAFYDAINRLAQIYLKTQAPLSAFTGLFTGTDPEDPNIITVKKMLVQTSNSAQYNRLDVARYFLNDLIKYDQNDWTIYQMFAQIELMEENDEKAIEYAAKSIEIDSTQYFNYYLLGFALNSSGKINEAIPVLEKAVQINPSAEEVFTILGDIYFSLEENKKAIDRYQKALRLNPESHIVLNNLAYLFSQLNIRLYEALDMAKKAVAEEPENKHYLDTLGWIYYMLGRYDEALGHIEKASRINNGSAVIFDHLGDIYQKLAKNDKAKEAWESSLQIDPSNESVKMKLNTK